MSTIKFTNRERQLIRSLAKASKQIVNVTNNLEEHGVEINVLYEAAGRVEDCIYEWFGIPKDNTIETISVEDGSTLPHTFCRDSLYEILTEFEDDEIEIEQYIDKLECYINYVVAPYFAEFPDLITANWQR